MICQVFSSGAVVCDTVTMKGEQLHLKFEKNLEPVVEKYDADYVAKIAAQKYLALTDEERRDWRADMWDRFNIKDNNTTANAVAASFQINREVGFPMTSSKPSRIPGARDILVIKDLLQIEQEFCKDQQKAA